MSRCWTTVFSGGGKAFDFVDRARDGFQFHDDVAEELAFGGVADGALVAEFVELADVVEDGGGEEQVDVELSVVPRYNFGQAAKADDVFEQAAHIGVMHDFGGGCALVACCGRGFGDDLQDELFEPGILQ